MDNSLPGEQAELLARSRSLPVDEFEWYMVGTAVNKPDYNEPDLIASIPIRAVVK